MDTRSVESRFVETCTYDGSSTTHFLFLFFYELNWHWLHFVRRKHTATEGSIGDFCRVLLDLLSRLRVLTARCCEYLSRSTRL